MMAVMAPVWKTSKEGVLHWMNHLSKKVCELTNPMTPRVTVPLRRGKQQQHLLRIAITNKEEKKQRLIVHFRRIHCTVR